MPDELATILRLVRDGTLSPEEAAPIIEALTRPAAGEPRGPGVKPQPGPSSTPGRSAGKGRRVRIQVSEKGRRVVDVRVPLAFAAMAARMVPGLPDRYASLIQEAVAADSIGPILDAEDEDGDAVLISVE
jgi:hypothetical protein